MRIKQKIQKNAFVYERIPETIFYLARKAMLEVLLSKQTYNLRKKKVGTFKKSSLFPFTLKKKNSLSHDSMLDACF